MSFDLQYENRLRLDASIFNLHKFAGLENKFFR